ncbi:MAG: hypothetical protein GF381_02840 [Candidatus Pacebacteria bacterium]|nr:hypothetical protein [Candidatus Paceibacterota bacterium]
MILLHVCCADCLLKFALSLDSGPIDLFYYNPNIHPRSEYLARLKAVKRVIAERGLQFKLIVPSYQPTHYFESIKQLKQPAKEKQERCPSCWQLRLGRTFRYAQENDYQAVSTTLLSSHYQGRELIKDLGLRMGKQAGIEFILPSKVCFDLSTKGFYKQNYCGCVYSLKSRLEEKYLKG